MTDWLPIFQRAGRLCREAYLANLESAGIRDTTGRGKGGDDTMGMDKLLEDIILREIEKEGNVSVVSEEAGELTYGTPDGVIVVDPLDGSYNFKNRVPFCATSIAFASGKRLGDTKTAYIIDLHTGDEYVAEKGKGASMNGTSMHVASGEQLRTIGMEFHPISAERARAAGNLIARARRVRCMGSVALNLAYTARGTHSASVDYRGCLRVLDSIAGLLLIEEAGGIVTGSRGEDVGDVPLSIDSSTDIVASCNAELNEAIVSALSMKEGWCVWVTGIPGSGKSTIARIASRILSDAGVEHVLLRPDEFRATLFPHPKYDDEERERLYGTLLLTAGGIVRAGGNVIIDATAHKSAWREAARKTFDRFAEVLVECNLETAVQRETARTESLATKEMYRKAMERMKDGSKHPGIGQVVGIDVPFERSELEELVLDSETKGADENGNSLAGHIISRFQTTLEKTLEGGKGRR